MAYQIQPDTKKGYIKMTYQSPTDTEEVMRGRKEMLQACRENNLHKILLDLSAVEAENSLSMFDCYSLAESWGKVKKRPPIILSIFMPQGRKEYSLVSFYITAAKNRCLTVEGFEDLESAEKWLADK